MVTVKDIRAATGLSQARFAALTGIPHRTIEDWERGIRTPAPYMLPMLAAYLREHGYIINEEEED